MKFDPETYARLLTWIQACLIVAAVCTTAFPLLYAFSPWYKSKLGRVLMLQAVAFAVVIDLTLLFQFWEPEFMIVFWIDAAALTLVAVASASITWLLWQFNHHKPFPKETKMSLVDVPPTEQKTHPLLSNKSYDQLKMLTTMILPAFGALYFGLAGLWNLPKADEIVGTCAVVATFFGVVLRLSTAAYNKSDEKYDGEIVVENNEEGVPVASLNLKNYENPADVVQQKEVLFKVT